MNKLKFGLVLILILLSSFSMAAEMSAVSSNACRALPKAKKPFILVLKSGEKLIPSLIKYAEDAEILSASLSGVGSLVDSKLAYFDMDKKQYQYKNFSGPYELISLNGNIARYEGKKVAHLHVTLGGPDYHVIGGHLDEATVGATAEITIVPLSGSIIKKISPETGLPAISPEK